MIYYELPQKVNPTPLFNMTNNAFRTSFNYDKVIQWFPGHMAKGLRIMSERMSKVDLVVEVRDARIPLSSINHKFDSIVKSKKRLIIYNKCDLANANYQKSIIDAFDSYQQQKVIFTDTRNLVHIKTIIEYGKGIALGKKQRFPEATMMVVGMPNVGKSSLINALRRVGVKKGKVASTGPEPGVTRKVVSVCRVCQDPSLLLVDTPGIMNPEIKDPETALKVALTGGIRDHISGETLLADYLLFLLNSQFNSRSYLQRYKLEQPVDDVYALLDHISHRISAVKKSGEADFESAARFFLKDYREGRFGRFTLDEISPDKLHEWFSKPAIDTNEETEIKS